ncbi:NUDIX hydrolase [Candidatus Amarobacter glycogenicus]|uniref:NUDIX hydrolase n=1 Tax=Candidatus Amarobacter glycogenicus TaxID=3140699 RepID=UPI002A0BFC34|nr:NUDIX hydrolase [Dehalococcoidia bacterium]
MPDPRLISTETAYAGRLFNVSLDTIEMDGGVIAYRETIRHPGAVAMVPVTAEGNLLLVTQYRHAAGRRLLELPAGTLEAGEAPLAAVSRELQEEVGHRPGKIEPLGGFFVVPGYATEFIHLFVCTELEPSTLDADDDEDIEVETLTPGEAIAALESGEICDAKSVIGILRWVRQVESRNR